MAILVFVGVVMSTVAIITGKIDKEDLAKNGKVGMACITSFGYMKGHGVVDFAYQVDGKEYLSWDYASGRFGNCIEDSSCIGTCYKLKYSTKHPENCKIFFDNPVVIKPAPIDTSRKEPDFIQSDNGTSVKPYWHQ